MNVEAVFTHFPELTTTRLRLRELRSSDAEALYVIKSNFEVTRRYSAEPWQSLNDSLNWIEKRLANYRSREGLVWAITLRDADQLIGECMLFHLDFEAGCGEIGYELN